MSSFCSSFSCYCSHCFSALTFFLSLAGFHLIWLATCHQLPHFIFFLFKANSLVYNNQLLSSICYLFYSRSVITNFCHGTFLAACFGPLSMFAMHFSSLFSPFKIELLHSGVSIPYFAAQSSHRQLHHYTHTLSPAVRAVSYVLFSHIWSHWYPWSVFSEMQTLYHCLYPSIIAGEWAPYTHSHMHTPYTESSVSPACFHSCLGNIKE